ncbi:uncharacterized protein DUF1576 [Roseiarcus fermentans]|uniref:Uncharacterized protein DUF1576 n=1 Tax=Roseiarcus fermentans TaxID=1473586 RepID=A0A366FG40_9HYPH|nr:DUF1576 domain-containing protein [Roseiarcus fermentans]RBP12930.1 uncharacterized protein DUF1576 [Roseiarcus fermentans]
MAIPTDERAPRPVPDGVVLSVVAAYAAAFVLFGLAVEPPGKVLGGLWAILTTRDALLTDYFGVGGIGGGCVSAGLLTLAAAFVYRRAGAPMTGAAVACLFLVLGFGLFGKNLLNVWPIVAGVALYARFRGEPFRVHINTAFFGAALAPIVSEILFSTTLAPLASVPLALATGLAIGFILPPAAAHLFRTHMGFSLYNMGFAAGIVGTLVVAMYKAFGYVPNPVFIWTTGANLLLSAFLAVVFASMAAVGYGLDRGAFRRLAVIFAAPGRAPTDFVALAGFGATLTNMGLAGALGAAYVLATGGDLNGPSIGAILTIVGFAAFGKHPRTIAPVMLGVFLGALSRAASPGDPSLTLAALFGTTLAPIAGRFGAGWGVVAGFAHASAALTVGPLHAGLNLYNNGFAAGIVAAVLVPVIVAIRAGLGYRDDLDAEAAAAK